MSDIPLSNGRVYRDGLILDFKAADRSGAAPQLDQLTRTLVRLMAAYGWTPPDDPFDATPWFTADEGNHP